MTVSAQKLNIVILGYLVRGPLGGLAWHHLQYVLGLVRLGHQVTYLEDSDDYASCFEPQQCQMTINPTYGLNFIKQSFQSIGLPAIWAYHDAHTSTWHGPKAESAVAACRDADVLLNLSGVNPLRYWLEGIPVRVLVDTDPVFTQLRHLDEAAAMVCAKKHNVFLSFAENIQRVDCTVPDDGLAWQPTRQPVVLNCWTNSCDPESQRFTSVMQWDSYSERRYRGRHYGMKSASFKPFMNLPERLNQSHGVQLELALGSHSAPRDRFQEHGWHLQDPLEITRSIDSYRTYIQGSIGEIGIAKHGYVISNSGWFSERSANYLACGRPVVVQDTGFGTWLKADEGVLAFTTPEQAADALISVREELPLHSEAARAIAVDYFDSARVLNTMLDTVFGSDMSQQRVASA